MSEDRNVSPESGRHWADAGAWPTAPGVHRIPLPLPSDGLRAMNVYAVEADDGLVLDRLAACLARLGPAGRTAYDVAADLTWTRRERAFADLDLFNQTLATLETRAHLELLVARGRATTDHDGDGDGDVPAYSANAAITASAVR